MQMDYRQQKPTPHILLPLIATLLCMLAIFILSAQPATVSDNNSKGIVGQVVNATVRLIGTDMAQQEKTELVAKVNSVARELMHAVVYFVLGIFAQITILGLYKKKLVASSITFIFCVTYGISDEIHQLFVPGRTFQLIDLVMDTTGASAAIALVGLTHIIIHKKSLKKKRKIN